MTEPKRQDHKPKPWEASVEAGSGSFGAWLRQQREVREITLREIADTSKIAMRYLEALEQDRFDVLPAPVFAKGFLRQYARYVGLDGDEVVNYYLAARSSGEDEEEEPEDPLPRPPSTAHWTYGLFLTAGVLVLFGVVAMLSFYAERRERREPPPPIAAPPVSVESVPLTPIVGAEHSAPLQVTLDFTQNCRVEALVDGEQHIDEHKVQGESLSIPAQSSVALTLSNVRGVTVEVNGRPYALDAKNGETVVIRTEEEGASEGTAN